MKKQQNPSVFTRPAKTAKAELKTMPPTKKSLVCNIERNETGVQIKITTDIDFGQILGTKDTLTYSLGNAAVLYPNENILNQFEEVTFKVDDSRTNKLFDNQKRINLAFLMGVGDFVNGKKETVFQLNEHPYSDEILKRFREKLKEKAVVIYDALMKSFSFIIKINECDLID